MTRLLRQGPEWARYVRYLVSNGNLGLGWRLVFDRLGERYRGDKIPPVYRMALDSLSASDGGSGEAPLYLPLSSGPLPSRPLPSPFLATRGWTLQNPPLWDIPADDPEDRFSLHRFGWMLPLLVYNERAPLPLLKEHVLSWIRHFPPQPRVAGWDTYSIAERTVHWLYLLTVLNLAGDNDQHFTATVQKSLKSQREILESRLEFRGDSTNNHLINDTRALYLLGAFLRQKRARDVGRTLLMTAIDQMFSASGFLREGSSHYQLLLCRTCLELYWCAEATLDGDMTDYLKHRLPSIVAASRFFLDGGALPLIGDVSPDFRTSFHADGHWYSFFHKQRASLPMTSKTSGLVSFPDAGYYRFSNNGYMVYSYVNPMNHIPAWSHAHADIGSFVMHWRNRPLLVDSGRVTYRDTPLGRYGRSVRSHNAVSIDGREPCLIHGLNGFPALMAEEFLQPAPNVTAESRDGDSRLSIEYHGFRRWIDGATVRRRFTFLERGMKIDDTIAGTGRHRVESFFHLHPDVKVERIEGKTLRLNRDGELLFLNMTSEAETVVDLAVGREKPSPAGWFFPEYGDQVPTTTVIYRQRTTLPVQNTYWIGPRNF